MSESDQYPDLMTAREVAAIFHFDPKTIWRWGKKGILHPVRTPTGRLRYDAAEVRRVFDQGVDQVTAELHAAADRVEPSEDALDIIRQRIEGDS